jgi:ligand-binding SRPBCC domain-containing protein
MPREYTWITAREEAYYEGHSVVADILIVEPLPLMINWPVRRAFGRSS